ncbi:hypothetical protein AAVH_25733 [Aphelenchoides avenae]|nr:hypothetical protein AAVH_25733 [Aphelenchus avenae]
MESAADKVPAKIRRIDGHDKTKIPHETMLEVLRWLDRFDLDAKQITSRRLRSLIENNQMPLRKVGRVSYKGCYGPLKEPNWLRICFEDDDRDDVELTSETDADVLKAASYLSTCFVRLFNVKDHTNTLPRNALIAAPPLIHDLDIRYCSFDKNEEDTLSATLNGGVFRCLSLISNSFPAWQIDDRLDGSEVQHTMTEEGVVSYCFTLDDDLPMPESRSLWIAGMTVTPAFFKKVVEASKNSRMTCDVELCLQHLRLDVSNLDVDVLPSRHQEDDPAEDSVIQHFRYDLADHGNGIRLLIHFTSKDNAEWDAMVRHGKKDHKEFFDPPVEEEENDDEEEEEEYDEEEEEDDEQD